MKHKLKIVRTPNPDYIGFKCVNGNCQYLLQFERATLAEIMVGADTLIYISAELNRRRLCPFWVSPNFEPGVTTWSTLNE